MGGIAFSATEVVLSKKLGRNEVRSNIIFGNKEIREHVTVVASTIKGAFQNKGFMQTLFSPYSKNKTTLGIREICGIIKNQKSKIFLL